MNSFLQRQVFNHIRPIEISAMQGCHRAHRKLFEVFSLTSPEEEEDTHG